MAEHRWLPDGCDAEHSPASNPHCVMAPADHATELEALVAKVMEDPEVEQWTIHVARTKLDGSVMPMSVESFIYTVLTAAWPALDLQLDKLDSIKQLFVDFPDPEAGPLPGELRQVLLAREAVHRGMAHMEQAVAGDADQDGSDG